MKLKPNSSFEDVIKPVRQLLDKAIANPNRAFVYKGYEANSHILDFKKMFLREGLEHNKEQGRDVFDLILMLAFNLGYACRELEEQGNKEAFLLINRTLKRLAIKDKRK